MKTLLSSVAVLVATASLAFAAAGWGDDFEKATAQAKAEKKLMLLDFTGSDWCPWCIKLDKEVFAKPDFKTFAKDNLVLVTVDFPHKKLSHKLEKQNEELKSKYHPDGFPTVLLVDAEGKEVHRIGGYKADAFADIKKAAEANKPQ